MRLRAATAVIGLSCGTFFLASATPVPRPAWRAPESPVRCRTDAEPHGDRMQGIAPQSYMVAPPPPPPPPPPAPSLASPPPAFVPAPVANVAPNMPIVHARAARSLAPPPYGAPGNRERYDGRAVAAVQQVATAPVSTFSIDVDTGAYANVRRFLNEGQAVPADAVRTEEMINYFRYDYPRPADRKTPFSVTTDVTRTPWNAGTRLLRIGLRGYDVAGDQRPAANIIFLVDTSGSMQDPDKLPLVKQALLGLAEKLRPDDRISIVAYAGSAGIVLEPTSDKRYVRTALECLEAGGSTAGGQGIALAYDTARAAFRKDGINRIFLATDGDFNVGISDNKALEALVERNRDDGVTLTTLGFGKGNYNEAMMERIADVGNGNYAYIDSADEARKVLEDELSATLFTIAKDVKVQVEFNPAQVSEYRLIGYENRALKEEDFNNDAVDAGDIGAGHQVTALYEIVPAGANGWTAERRYPANRPAAPRATGAELAFVKLRYKPASGGGSCLIERAVPAALIASAAPPRGDTAFAIAVAGFGQKLRGDAYLGSYGYDQIAALAGSPVDGWRRQFVDLVRKAGDRARPGKES